MILTCLFIILGSVIILSLPLLWHLWNDRNGDAPSDKTKDIWIVSIATVVVAVVCFLLFDKYFIYGLLLSAAIHFFAFDYLIVWILKRRGIIETKQSAFEYLGSSYTDDVLRQWKPWTRFWIKLGQLIVAIIIYFI